MAKSSWIGKKLGNRYLIEEMLGQGGMSAVYKATDPNLRRVVAVKLIHTHLSDNPDFVKRFEEEAAAVAQLRHHGIIQVYDFNQDDEVYYMVLEFVPGETIQDHLKRLNDNKRLLSPMKAAEYMAGVCDAVDYAHQRGMIHRDIKPANLMLNPHGQVILMDFGIAKIVGGQRHTATGAVVGTAMYMSPEQIRGEQPDRRSDIYSLGVTLFEMISGHPPFQADSAMTLMMMHVNDPVPDPRKLNPDIPDDLVAVINKALAKDPNDRYQTAAQMASALRNVVAGITSRASGQMSIPGGTMIEEAPMPKTKASADATAFDIPSMPSGTVIDSKPLPKMPASGTVVESAPHSTMPSVKKTDVGGTAIESSAIRPIPSQKPASVSAKPKKTGVSIPLIAGSLVAIACLAIGGIFFASQFFGGNEEPTSIPTEEVVVLATDAPTDIVVLESTATSEPTEIPTETPIPFTPTPDTPYVVITAIRLENNVYVVDFEMVNYPSAPQLHVHMFFNTVPPQQAGSPGAGPWKLTGGSYGASPFTQYGPANRPANATQMCALVANTNHSIILNSGNCVDLP